MSAGIATVGLIGLGNMGGPMAANLAKAGFALRLHDSNPQLAAKVAADTGATASPSLAGFGRGLQFVITMLPTGAVVREVTMALAPHLDAGTILIDMSSSEPLGTRELGTLLAARGLVLIDAPVSGGVPGAIAGTLSIMAGADDASTLEKARPVLEALGKRLFPTGKLGSGHATKALNNFVASAAYAANAEAVAIGKKFGLDPAQLIDIFNVSTGRSFESEVVFAQHVVTGKFSTGFTLGLLAKDVAIATDLGTAMAVDAPLSILLKQRWKQAAESLGPQADHSRALQAWND